MLFKYLDYLKQIDEKDLKDLLDNAFTFFASNKNQKIDDKIMQSNMLKTAFSCLVRFYRSINIYKKVEEEQISFHMKEIFKGKSAELLTTMQNQINTVVNIYNKRINFSEINLSDNKLHYNKDEELDSDYYAKRNFLLNNIFELRNFSWKINIKISNSITNRVLLPEIIFIFSLDNGRTYSFYIDIKIFQELRRLLTMHIKKIMEIEQIPLLK